MRQFVKDLYDNREFSPKDVEFQPRNYCEIIHIGLVCSGYSSNVHFHALSKSLLLTRSNPIHLHLLVDSESEIILKTLFRTWQVPQIFISYYNIKTWLKDVRWVPNSHYSGNYGLLKLIFPKVVRSNVTTKLLILDTDLLLNGDIYLLWKIFNEFNYKQAIGLVENQSQYYLGKLNKAHPWPALGTGFNSGVLLYDLEKMNAFRWDLLWTNLTKRLSIVYGQADLGDQDIINGLIVEYPDIVFRLPCYWNTQMSDKSQSSACYKSHKPMIVHWNSPKKYDVTTRDGDKFRGLANAIFELDGNWFRRTPLMCEDRERAALPIPMGDDCDQYTKPAGAFYRTLLFFKEYRYVADENDITYVTHLSYDRLYLMEDIAKVWSGPLSFSLYVTDAELVKSMRFVSNSLILKDRTDIAYHAVFREGDLYPINVLRNTGLQNVNTPFVFLIDVDFVPMKNLFAILKDNIRSMGDLKQKALIVPAFAATSAGTDVPSNKIELIEYLDAKKIRPFLSDVWTFGHSPTDFAKWKKELEPYKVTWRTDFEPYIVVGRDVVRYDERFLGFGWNKVSHIMELEAQNYEFVVLSDVFIIHQPHQTSWDYIMYKRSSLYRRCLQTLKHKFVEGLHRKYNRTFEDWNATKTSSRYPFQRRKRDAVAETTTTLYDSTDYYLVWGGKEKAEGRKEYKKSFAKKIQDSSPENRKESDYYYYDSVHPYNASRMAAGGHVKNVTFLSSEEHDYDYDEDDEHFKEVHDSTTTIPDNITLVEEEVDERSKILSNIT
ncbi:xylosyl- and glucuronyltransferase LARGE2-like [Rhynchophorus ferrugineus]|uniref:xylosyl- and glucuronyltransferase LARGE2-like n=1 Tax=Rhynchophorus ferrugineus TaxID=354439 RepID=UPI003FCCD636